MIDRSETVLPGSSPDAEAESTVQTVAEEPAIVASWPAQSTVASSRLDRAIWGAGEVLRRHWMLALLIAGGLLLRVVTQLAYEPALLFIDSKKYLYGTDFSLGAWGSFDPIGYTLLVLKPVLMFTNLGFVALLQHVLGLGMAVALYVLMLRRGVVRWLAALAVAPGPARRLPAERGTDDHARRAVRGAGGDRDRAAVLAARGPRWPSSSWPASRSARRRRSARSARR